MIDFFSEHRRGLFGTMIFHGLIIAGVIILKLVAPWPPPDEDGIMINFGTDEEGTGLVEPIQRELTTPEAQESNNDAEEEEVVPPSTIPESIPEVVEAKAEDILTQEEEEAPEIKTAKTQAEIDAEKKREEERERQQREEEERLQKEEEERLRLAEIERLHQIDLEKERREEAERKAREEAERKKQEEEARAKKEISDRVKASFSNLGEGDVNKKVSEGSLYKGGNEGSPTGSGETKNRANTDSKGTNGITFSLEGRNPIGKLKKPSFPGNESGKVVVKIIVDKNGKIISATPGVRGTTIGKISLWEAAKKAALLALFDKAKNPNAPNQQGTITYDFTLY